MARSRMGARLLRRRMLVLPPVDIKRLVYEEHRAGRTNMTIILFSMPVRRLLEALDVISRRSFEAAEALEEAGSRIIDALGEVGDVLLAAGRSRGSRQ